MNLTSDDFETLEHLLQIGDIIYSFYFDSNPKDNIESLIKCLDIELDLLSSIKINSFKLEEVEDCFQKCIKDLPSVDLLQGTSPHLKRDSYPYIRTLATLKYRLNSHHSQKIFDRSFLDQEVSILHMLLNKASLDKPELNKKLQNYSYKILIDSPTAEKQILLNNLEPQSSIITIYSSKRCQYLLYNLINRLLYRIIYEQQKEYPNLENSPEFQLLMNYLKTVLLYIEPAYRRESIEQVLTEKPFDAATINLIPTLRTFTEPIYQELQELENTSIKHFSLVPLK